MDKSLFQTTVSKNKLVVDYEFLSTSNNATDHINQNII